MQNSVCALYNHCRGPSMWSEAPASWDFSVTQGRIYAIKWCMSLKQHINKEKTIEVCWRFPILWVWDNTFTTFGRNLSEDAFHKFLCSAQHHPTADHARQLFWCMFPQNQIAKEDHDFYTTPNIWLLCVKSDFATFNSNEGLGWQLCILYAVCVVRQRRGGMTVLCTLFALLGRVGMMVLCTLSVLSGRVGLMVFCTLSVLSGRVG